MKPEEQQSDRDFERQALYSQYVAYSKAAARMLTLLLLVSIYTVLTFAENYDVIKAATRDAPEDTTWSSTNPRFRRGDYRFQGLGSRVPHVEKHVEESVSTALDTTNFSLPGINKRVSSRLFFISAPVAVFLITSIFWIYLGRSLMTYRQLNRFVGFMGSRIPEAPWLYTAMFSTPKTRTLWRATLELQPVLVIFIFFLMYSSASEYYFHEILIVTLAAVLVPAIHGIALGVKPRWTGSMLLLCITLMGFFEWWLITWMVMGGGAWSLTLCFFAALLFSGFLLFGTNHIAYFRYRYKELKDMERGSKPRPNSLLPSKD